MSEKVTLKPWVRCYAREGLSPKDLPRPWLFLAGPTPRNMDTPSWRGAAIDYLDGNDHGSVLIPEDEDFGSFDESLMDQQVEWEWRALDAADAILFWVPRNMSTLPGLTTNVEYGMYASSGKVVLGFPSHGEHNGYLERIAKRYRIKVCLTLKDTVYWGASLARSNNWRGYPI